MALLVQTLADTIRPLLALQQLKPDFVLPRGADPGHALSGSVRLRWALIPVSPVHFRLLYRGQVGLELRLFADGAVGVRDLASAAPAFLLPLLGLRAFLVLLSPWQ